MVFAAVSTLRLGGVSPKIWPLLSLMLLTVTSVYSLPQIWDDRLSADLPAGASSSGHLLAAAHPSPGQIPVAPVRGAAMTMGSGSFADCSDNEDKINVVQDSLHSRNECIEDTSGQTARLCSQCAALLNRPEKDCCSNNYNEVHWCKRLVSFARRLPIKALH